MTVVLTVTIFAVCLCVAIHYQALVQLTRLAPRTLSGRRGGVLIGVLGAMLAHVAEIGVFATAYGLLISSGRYGGLRGQEGEAVGECFYFSFVSFTTLGFGDLTPFGPIRWLTAAEALTGLVLVTWTASFLFLQMQHSWKQRGALDPFLKTDDRRGQVHGNSKEQTHE